MKESEITSKYQTHNYGYRCTKAFHSKLWRRNLVNIIILLAYISVHVYLSFHHEAWRDESQAWVIARNASFHDVLALCASEGHPCLWFYFLKVCVFCGISFYHFSLISTLIMTGAAALLLWKSPFSLLSNLCILLSPVFFYYNPVICRIYAIVVLLCMLLCVWWPQRRESPIVYGIIVAAIFQSHILMAGLAIGCLVEMVVCCKGHFRIKNIIGFLIPLASFICMILELRQTEQTETFLHIDAKSMISQLTGGNVEKAFRNIIDRFEYNGIPVGVIFIYVCMFFLLAFVVLYIKHKQFCLKAKGVGIISLCGIAFYWSIIILVRSAAHKQMAIVLWILILVFVWLATKALKSSDRNNNRDKIITSKSTEALRNVIQKRIIPYIFEILFVVCSVLAIPQTICIDAVSDINEPFSGSREIVDLITDIAPEDSVIVLHNGFLSTSIVSYLYDAGKNYILWDIDNGEEYSIHKWGKKDARTIDNESLYEMIHSDLGEKGSVYYVNAQQSLDFDDLASEQMVLIGQNGVPNKWLEYYQLYELKWIINKDDDS